MADKPSVKKLTYKIFGSLADLLLWYTYLVGASFGKSGPRGFPQAFAEADEMLDKFNHHTLVATWHQLKKKKLLTYQKRENLYNPEITEFGKKRLEQTLPVYHEIRPWNGKLYLITYDIYENAHQKRNKFRKYIKELGCKKLLESVWLTPYNFRELLNDYIKNKKIPGTIIISDIGKDGGIGETSVIDLITKLYDLETINDQYELFIRNVKGKNVPVLRLIFEYLSILKKDPQLPFELFPNRFLGTKAYHLYKNLQNKYIQTLVRPDSK